MLAGADNDTFELATFFHPKSKKVLAISSSFFEAVFFVLSVAGTGTSNIEPIQQQLYDELLFSKQLTSRGKWLFIPNIIEKISRIVKYSHELHFILTGFVHAFGVFLTNLLFIPNFCAVFPNTYIFL